MDEAGVEIGRQRFSKDKKKDFKKISHALLAKNYPFHLEITFEDLSEFKT